MKKSTISIPRTCWKGIIRASPPENTQHMTRQGEKERGEGKRREGGSEKEEGNRKEREGTEERRE
jgi:hypothetical protein